MTVPLKESKLHLVMSDFRYIPKVDPLLTTEQVARHLQLTTRAVQNLRDRRTLPFIRVNARVIRYRLSDIEKALSC